MMNSSVMQQLVFAAGLLHFCQVPAMLIAPRMLQWKDDLARLQPINRRIAQVLGVAIVIVVLGLGAVVMLAADELVNSSRLAAGMTAFLAVFWLYRAIVQVLVYRRMWPRGPVGLASHFGLTALFFALSAIYSAAFAFNVR
jgi:hypothetical protein